MTTPTPPTPPQAASAPAPQQPVSGLAIGSMATGIASVVLCGLGVLLGPIAVVLGFIDRSKGGRSGQGLTGIITGFAGTVFSGVVVALVAAGAIFASETVDDISVDVDQIIRDNFPDATFGPEDPQPGDEPDYGSLPVDERLRFPLTEDYIAASGFPTAYDAWVSAYSPGGAWDGRYDGNPVETPCYTFDGAPFWTLDISQENVDVCLVEYELWFETYSGQDEYVIKQFGFGGAGSGIEVEAVSRGFSDTNFPGQDVDAMTTYMLDNFFVGDSFVGVTTSTGELGGLPAVIFDVESSYLERYRTYAVFTPKVYPGSVPGESEFFLVTVWNEVEWVADSDDAIAQLEASFTWK